MKLRLLTFYTQIFKRTFKIVPIIGWIRHNHRTANPAREPYKIWQRPPFFFILPVFSLQRSCFPPFFRWFLLIGASAEERELETKPFTLQVIFLLIFPSTTRTIFGNCVMNRLLT